MNPRPPGSVRIIGGQLRGSKLPVADRPGLRPSSDRVRETLFNWLQSAVPGARALDLFAGTGALGFEAASRGARRVVLVERDPALADSLRASAARLKATTVEVACADALAWLRAPRTEQFDLVFLDPPFALDLWQAAAAGLAPWLAPGAFIYVEAPQAGWPVLPAGWRLHREGRTRDVRFGLFVADGSEACESADTLAGEPNAQVKPSA
jgi:16S rRNA (guanine966-N2)-methyltransferase